MRLRACENRRGSHALLGFRGLQLCGRSEVTQLLHPSEIRFGLVQLRFGLLELRRVEPSVDVGQGLPGLDLIAFLDENALHVATVGGREIGIALATHLTGKIEV